MMTRAVPVLMYHSVAPEEYLAPHGWLQRLATPPALMEATFERWKRDRWRTIGLEELSDWLDGAGVIPPNSLVLTLDDGYLDNWVALEPMLRAYGFRAVVFMSTDFLDPRPGTRPQSGERPDSDLDWKGYLSPDELRASEARGTIEFGSHARTHTWWFTSDRIVDWYRPDRSVGSRSSLLRFLWLNNHPERKPYVLSEMTPDSIPWGTPIYEYAPALVARRFVPDPEEARIAIDWVGARGGPAFFQSEDWRRTLEREIARYREGRPPRSERETDAEYLGRVRDELAGSREILSRVLGRDVRILSCPQGAMNHAVERIAKEVGYRRWTMSVWRHARLNVPGASNRHIYRCGRGYELFGMQRRHATLVRSQAIALSRYAGSVWGRMATGGLTIAGRLVGRGGAHDGPS